MALQPGEIIDGKYRIVRLVGEGGMGAVYEGDNTRIHRRVAIKVLHSAVAEKVDVVQRFEREAQAAGRIGSEHIVEVLDLGNLPSGERYMVMEFLDGEDLTSRIRRLKRLRPDQALPLLHQVLEGLAAAHASSIIHRDLKPDNIYIINSKAGRSDFVKILDFGVSKFSALDNEMSMTRTGAVMGTPYYMSPEQAKGGKIDQRSDLYAVGVVLYQMITGRVPFNASSFNELLFKIALEAPEPIETVVPGIPKSFADLVTRAMAREPEHRFQSAREFQEALASWQMTAPPAAVIQKTEPLPAMPDLRLPVAATPYYDQTVGLPTPQQRQPGMQQSYPGLPPGTPIPGTQTTAGNLGLSQSALAVTPQPKSSKSGMMVALVAVTVGILGVGAVGAYVLTRAPSDAGPAQAGAETPTAEPAEAEPTAEPEAEPSAEAEETSSVVPLDSAEPVEPPPTATPPVTVATRPTTPTQTKTKTPPKEDKPPEPPPKPSGTQKGRAIKTEL